ncbi:MAG: alpha/beta fold hydrolase, partial [Halobacteriota archaeon]
MKEDQSIDVDGAKIYVHREGRDGDIPILLVHGIVLTHDMWRYQVSYLTENGYQLIAPDLRGFGDSHADNPEDPANYTYEVWADDLRAVINHFQLQHIILAGYSMGGAVVLRYMLGSHEPVDKLVLVSTTGPCMHARLPSLFETLR